MAFTTKEQAIIDWSIKNGKSMQDTRDAISRFRATGSPVDTTKKIEVAKPTFIQDATQDIKETGTALKKTILAGADKVGEIQKANQAGEQGGLRSFLQIVGTGAGTAGKAIGDITLGTAKTIAPQGVEDFTAKTAQAAITPIVQSEPVQAMLSKYESLPPQQQRDIDAALGALGLGASITGVGAGAKLAVKSGELAFNGAKAATQAVKETAASALEGIPKVGTAGIKEALDSGKNAASIMQRVARVSPTKQRDFLERSGTTIGDYLVKKQIFGDANEVASQLVKNLQTTKKQVDTGLASLKGTYKNSATGTALRQLADREANVSSAGALSKDLERVTELLKLHSRRGLTLSEHNEVKRLYERNVKLDYKRENLPTKVEGANNVDNAMRKFIEERATELGFKNVRELNRETSLAKQLADDIGEAYAGREANNLITLTDWVLLSGGDPTAASAFIGKKILSSGKVQGAVARMLGKGKGTQPVKSEFGNPTIDAYAKFIESQTKQQ